MDLLDTPEKIEATFPQSIAHLKTLIDRDTSHIMHRAGYVPSSDAVKAFHENFKNQIWQAIQNEVGDEIEQVLQYEQAEKAYVTLSNNLYKQAVKREVHKDSSSHEGHSRDDNPPSWGI